MEISIIVGLIFVSLVGLVKLPARYDRGVSWGMFLCGVYAFMQCTSSVFSNKLNGFSFLWNETKVGNIYIDFTSQIMATHLIIPVFLLSLLSVLNNNIYRYEEHRSVFNALLLTNVIVLTMLVCAQNYVQLITSVFLSDIIGYAVLKDVDSSRRYVIYNFFADSCLFMLFSFACGKVHSLELGTLFSYEQLGKYKNFISCVAMLALLFKVGCFLFQSYLLDVANVRFQRLSTVNLLFSPLCGFLLLIKLHNLMMLSPYFMPIYNFFAALSIIAGCLFFVLLDDIRKKMVYLNMFFFGLIMQVLAENGFAWNNNLSVLYVLIFFFNFLFFTIYLHQNREVLVSRMHGIGGMHTRSLKMILIQFVLLANIGLTVICQISANLGNTKIIYEGMGIFFAMTIVLNHIYKQEILYVHKNIKLNFGKFAFFVLMFVMLGMGSIYFKAYQWQNLIFIILFLMGIANKEIHKAITMYKKSYFYEGDFGRFICRYCIVIPVEYTSRLLWLTVDFLLAEKTISNFFLWIDKRLVSSFNIINVKGYMAYLWLMILGVLLFVLAFYRGNLL